VLDDDDGWYGLVFNLQLHHVNLCWGNPDEMKQFYCDVLGLGDLPEVAALRVGFDKLPRTAHFVDAGPTQLHLSTTNPTLHMKVEKTVNPVAHGHIAFRTDNLDEVIGVLEAARIPYSNYGTWAIRGWRQIYLYDPSGHVVEIHEVVDEGQADA
jgi:glyoxylase I family protein